MEAKVNRDKRAFQPLSGHRALDLLATLRDRHRDPTECLRTPADLDRWLAASALHVETASTDQQLDQGRRLRETLYPVVRAVLDQRRPPAEELRELNAWACRPPLAPQVADTLEPRWTGDVEAALATIAREAVEVLAGPDRLLIRECAAAPACSRIYLDRSPGRRRRWCHMQLCGSTSKMRTYRERRTGRDTRTPAKH